MGQRDKRRQKKQHKRPPKANDHLNRSAETKSQQSNNVYHSDPAKGGPGVLVGEIKMENKSLKEVSLTESTDKNAEEDIREKECESVSFDSNCNKSKCMQIKTQILELLAEKIYYVETIKSLKEEIQWLTPKYSQEGSKGRFQKPERQKSRSSNNISEEEKYVIGAGVQQSYVDSADYWTLGDRATSQQNTSRAYKAERKNHRLLCQQERDCGDTAGGSPPNNMYNWPEQNRTERSQRQDFYEKKCQDGSSRSSSRDCRPQYECHGRRNRHYGQSQQYEHGQQQGRRNNQTGQQLVKRKKVVNEIEGDLFTAPKTSSLAHCVAEDMCMGSGIAVRFRQMFRRVDELLAQGAQTGEVAVLEDECRFIYYLVTKRLSKGKPWMESLGSSLLKMRQHMLANNVHDVAMPRIGCGLDGLNWHYVRNLLFEIFGEDDVSITVYNFNPNNFSKEITMEADTSTKHTIAPKDANFTGPSGGPSGAITDKNHISWEKKSKEDSRSQTDKSLEEVTINCYSNSMSEEEKHVNSVSTDPGAGIQQNWDDSTYLTQVDRASSQQDASKEYEAETKNNSLLQQQERNWADVKEGLPPNNMTYKLPEQNRNKKIQSQGLCEARCQGGRNGSDSRDLRQQDGCHGREDEHNEQRQQFEYGQQQGRGGERCRNNQRQQPVKCKRVVSEIEGDLFTAPKTSSLAHCVAEDMTMGSGIAVKFRQMFKERNELLAQRARTGQVAVLEDEGRFIYYLVTKKQSNGKPYFEDLKSSLIKMREHMLANSVHEVAMPRIGCGLDRLEWRNVSSLLIEIFGEDDVSITVYNFNQGWGRHRHASDASSSDSSPSDKKYSCKEKIKGKKVEKQEKQKRKKQKHKQKKKHK